MTYVIAEVGSVHDGSFGNALRLIDAAASCGADAVKFQTHLAEAETLRDAPMPPYFKGEPRYEYFQRTAFTPSQWQSLRDRCGEAGVDFISSPFSVDAVDLLESVGVDRYKIPSGEVTNLPLLEAVAQTGRAAILSSGMSNWHELDQAVALLRAGGELAVLQCTSAYPCPAERVGLNVMISMRERYGVEVGFSDHTLTNYASFAAVALGASIVEKHFTFSRRMYGSDAPHSLEPEEFSALVEGVRDIEIMRDTPVDKDDLAPYRDMKRIFEKSVVTVCAIPAGTALKAEMLGLRKPGTGFPAMRLSSLIGRRLVRALPAHHLLQESDMEPQAFSTP